MTQNKQYIEQHKPEEQHKNYGEQHKNYYLFIRRDE